MLTQRLTHHLYLTNLKVKGLRPLYIFNSFSVGLDFRCENLM